MTKRLDSAIYRADRDQATAVWELDGGAMLSTPRSAYEQGFDEGTRRALKILNAQFDSQHTDVETEDEGMRRVRIRTTTTIYIGDPAADIEGTL